MDDSEKLGAELAAKYAPDGEGPYAGVAFPDDIARALGELMSACEGQTDAFKLAAVTALIREFHNRARVGIELMVAKTGVKR